jgi:crotonobetainyl-CoA:carnitine CoA-transferase CaiB-like acyl-CoA transferase|tara:strand:+ start:4751 stop:6022 length:1272 start_codon:yes stop_codon:yes gene_type:complete
MEGMYTGIRILEFCSDMAGAFAGQICADRGAEVIKVEPLGGDPLRSVDSYQDNESKLFQSLNRGKKSLCIDLACSGSSTLLDRLVASADVIIMGLERDQCAEFKLDYGSVKSQNPNVVYIQIDYFGSQGDWAGRPANDLVMQAFSGMLLSEGKRNDSGTPRTIVSLRMAERSTGLMVALAVSTGLFHRSRSGQGQLIETSQLKNLLALQSGRISDNPVADEPLRTPRQGRIKELRQRNAPFHDYLPDGTAGRVAFGVVFYRPYQTKDGAVFMGALSRPLRDKARIALQSEYLHRDDPNYDPDNPEFVAFCVEQAAIIVAKFRTKTTAEWMEIFEREGVPAGRVMFPEDLSSAPQVVENDYVIAVDHETAGRQIHVAPHAQFGLFPLGSLTGSPSLGRDTDECLRELGFTEEDAEAMRRQGAVR